EQYSQGLLWAGWIAAVPAIFTLSGLFPGTYLNGLDVVSTQLVKSPGLTVLSTPIDLFSVLIFALLLPLVSQRVPTRLLSLLVFWPIAAGVAYILLPFITGAAAATLSALLITALGIALYLRHGVLAVIAAGKGTMALWSAASLFNSGDANQGSVFVI